MCVCVCVCVWCVLCDSLLLFVVRMPVCLIVFCDGQVGDILGSEGGMPAEEAEPDHYVDKDVSCARA